MMPANALTSHASSAALDDLYCRLPTADRSLLATKPHAGSDKALQTEGKFLEEQRMKRLCSDRSVASAQRAAEGQVRVRTAPCPTRQAIPRNTSRPTKLQQVRPNAENQRCFDGHRFGELAKGLLSPTRARRGTDAHGVEAVEGG